MSVKHHVDIDADGARDDIDADADANADANVDAGASTVSVVKPWTSHAWHNTL